LLNDCCGWHTIYLLAQEPVDRQRHAESFQDGFAHAVGVVAVGQQHCGEGSRILARIEREHATSGLTVRGERLRKRLERMFQKMVEAAPCSMVMIDARGRIVLVNQQAEVMFGYTRAELIGDALELLLPERLRATHTGHRQAFAAAPSMRQMGMGRDLTARRKDGTEFPVEIGLNPVPGDEGGGLVLAAVTDITRRKAMELELQQANANLEEFTYAASHDLKSPLRGIADLLEWIVEDLDGLQSAEVTRNLGRIGDRIRRLERVIDDLLTYARAGTMSAEVIPVDPRALIDVDLRRSAQGIGPERTLAQELRRDLLNARRRYRAALEEGLRGLAGRRRQGQPPARPVAAARGMP